METATRRMSLSVRSRWRVQGAALGFSGVQRGVVACGGIGIASQSLAFTSGRRNLLRIGCGKMGVVTVNFAAPAGGHVP